MIELQQNIRKQKQFPKSKRQNSKGKRAKSAERQKGKKGKKGKRTKGQKGKRAKGQKGQKKAKRAKTQMRKANHFEKIRWMLLSEKKDFEVIPSNDL